MGAHHSRSKICVLYWKEGLGLFSWQWSSEGKMSVQTLLKEGLKDSRLSLDECRNIRVS